MSFVGSKFAMGSCLSALYEEDLAVYVTLLVIP